MRQIRTKCMWLCLLFTVGLYAQQKTISGVVTNDFGETLFGANVIIDGTATGTQTDLDGRDSVTAI